MQAPPKPEYPVIDVHTLAKADGFVFAFPTRYVLRTTADLQQQPVDVTVLKAFTHPNPTQKRLYTHHTCMVMLQQVQQYVQWIYTLLPSSNTACTGLDCLQHSSKPSWTQLGSYGSKGLCWESPAP